MPEETPKPGSHESQRRIWLVLFGLVVAWSTYLYFFGPGGWRGDLPTPALRTPMVPSRTDYRWNLVTLDGQPFELSQLRGRPIFLNLWATWCPPCVAEMPSIEALAANPRLEGVQFACVAIGDTTESVRAFVDRHKLKVPVFEAAEPPPGPFLTEGIPATFVIDAEGQIVSQEIGSAQWDAPSVVDFLESLVKTSAEGL